MKSFDVPVMYRSPLISAIKKKRKEADRMKKDFSPTLLDFGPMRIYLARHFGFCYGVENAIDIAFRTVDENPGKRIFLLSEMIHNPQVNYDLRSRGVQFLQDNHGKQIVPFEELAADDVVLIPAFGTTLAIEAQLKAIGIPTEKYDTTCPFVEKVWNRSEVIAKSDYTIIIHGKPSHEETRATFSHAAANAPSVVVKDLKQTMELAKYITGQKDAAGFYNEFAGQYSEDFDVNQHLQRIGVVNQTTMLASDTQGIADYLKGVMQDHFGLDETNIKERFADTRDTLCYATNDNQTAVTGMLDTPADLAIVVGGYNSSNTSHLVELCEEKLPTYYISSEAKILSEQTISHYNFHDKIESVTEGYLPQKETVNILITSGASCPDAVVEEVIRKLHGYFPGAKAFDELVAEFA
ncbi:4-hydroxy-3-methylbut-2-enyl diphosphate reductase [Cnuella takakiae]|uniref:4-hydroxy-3-methylbut-2-enyl diphosphate reductase n=1 Tax=Cnuella takakiae TaxID=1302690 RepID=A0A1M4VL10_9BACT|nr:4-hydroxy-3-methylbut-2-enyl diphosphate reductase [Cnuella takakiae]OLY92566.1 4-hydroxy-3-methylbut-2-enyl diphosphate reductase [Cnuella takakiae]SHE69567.1 4-hydroxy-3-methylbut-2-enyl diphosphate reductase [Cnuella takakiae]